MNKSKKDNNNVFTLKSYIILLGVVVGIGFIIFSINFLYIKSLQLGTYTEMVFLKGNNLIVTLWLVESIFLTVFLALLNLIISKRINATISEIKKLYRKL